MANPFRRRPLDPVRVRTTMLELRGYCVCDSWAECNAVEQALPDRMLDRQPMDFTDGSRRWKLTDLGAR